ncbi:DUF6998 domain-containing protein [Longimicrobium sp.]|jgi:hypothetical protein|uniref:DUF6998 domain-containing protein n=1 Tax=Longimicrobium sp. TaxID=2029185 RepID=UPI002EDA4A8A
MQMPNTSERVFELLAEAKKLAEEFRQLTGKPLGITGEVAEYEAARLLGLELSTARQPGYDAVLHTPDGEWRLQIKGRCVPDASSPSQRLGSIRLEKEWDAVLVVLMDEDLDAVEIYEADRDAIEAALLAPGLKRETNVAR